MALTVGARVGPYRVLSLLGKGEMQVPKGSFLPYDVAKDGRFLVDTLDSRSTDPSAGITVVLNWMSR